MNLFIVGLLVTGLICGNNQVNSLKTVSNESLFIAWNNATLISLNQQIKSAKSGNEKKKYENSKMAFQLFVSISKGNKVDSQSIRFKFLQQIRNNYNLENIGFYIIEANRSGERVLIRNYLVLLDSKENVTVQVYHYDGGKWFKKIENKK